MSINILLAGGNDNLLEIIGLKNGANDSFINNATVTAQVNDSSNNALPGMTWPATLNYSSGSDGDYRLVLERDLNLVAGDRYIIKITAVSGGLDAEWIHHIKAIIRS